LVPIGNSYLETVGGFNSFIQKISQGINIGITEFDQGDFFVYPNLSNGNNNIYIDLGNSKNVTVSLFNLQGKLIFREININSKFYEFSVDEPSGLYFIEIDALEKKHTYKFIHN